GCFPIRLASAHTPTCMSHAALEVSGACAALAVSIRPHCPTRPTATASVVRVGVPPSDAAALRELGCNHGDKAGRLSVGSVAIVSGKCLLWPGNTIIPNNLTMPLLIEHDGYTILFSIPLIGIGTLGSLVVSVVAMVLRRHV